MYSLKSSGSEAAIIKQALQAGEEIPENILNAPELFLGLQLYYEAFFDLNSERSHGMGLTAIPWSRIKDYAVAYEFDEDQTENLFIYIRAMDNANITYLESKQPKKETQTSKGK